MADEVKDVMDIVTETPSGTDVDAVTGKPITTDAVVDPNAKPAEDDTKPAESEPQYLLEVDGQKLTEEDIRSAVTSHANETKWKGELSQKGEELNVIQRALEERRLQAINPTVDPAQPRTPQTSRITGEQLQEMIYNKPDEALSQIDNLIQDAVNQAVRDYSSKQEIKDAFMRDYPAFNETVNSREFQTFMLSKPYFNPVNGYLAYDAIQKGKEGFNKGEQDTIKNLKAKGGIKVLSGGGATIPQTPPNLKDLSEADFLNAATQALLKKREAIGG